MLDAVSSSGVTARDYILKLAFPDLGERPVEGTEEWHSRRLRAEAAVSRAIRSLERKGLVARDRNDVSGRIQVRAAGPTPLPPWEQLARGEEDLAALCRRMSDSWHELFARARNRAERIRAERSGASTAAEREADLDEVSRLEGQG